MGNNVAKEKSEQIINYYIFQKQIENIIKIGENPLNHQPKEICIYILNLQWIKKWKLYTNYEEVKKELDLIKDNDENSLITKLNERCELLIKYDMIDNSKNLQPGNYDEYNHFDFGNKVLNLPFFKDEVLEALVDEKTFSSFFGIFEKIYNFISIISIKGIITNRIFILMMNQNKKIKLFYKEDMKNNNSIIQLTVKLPDESIFEDYCQNYKTKTSKNIINNLKEKNVRNKKKNIINNCIFINEFLNVKDLIEEININSINFQNIRTNFIGLDNISSLPYLNAVIQNLVNIPYLTKYLIDESNFNIINKNQNDCYFTYFICRIFSNLYYEKDINSFSLNSLNALIYLIDSKFMLDENCIPGELIKFILEKINNEYIEFFKRNNKAYDSTIISNTFLCQNVNITKCNNCQNKKSEFTFSFLYEFHLDVVYNEYINIKDKINKDGKYILTLELCFKHLNEPLKLGLESCEKCRKNTEHEIKNDLFNLPNTLIIIVNKERDKNNEYEFSFPEELNLQKFINEQSNTTNYKYKLIGIISHKESKKEYYAFCKHSISNKWYKCKDLLIEICFNPIKENLNYNVDVLIYESFRGSMNSINIQNIDESINTNRINNNNINLMPFTPNNNININNNDNDDDNSETLRILNEKRKSKL